MEQRNNTIVYCDYLRKDHFIEPVHICDLLLITSVVTVV
jgi:hypothetical protein